MRFTWLSNAPFATTGYGNQSRLFLPRLKALGHDPACIAFWGLDAGIINWNGIPIYPKGHALYGQDVASAHTVHHGADVLFSLMDAWVIDPQQLRTARWVPWFPVDMEPLPEIIREKVARSYHRVVMSQFGMNMATDAGLDAFYVPHGVETDVFKPGDRAEARGKIKAFYGGTNQYGQRMELPTDAFVVGIVAANNGYPSRKNLPQQLEAFARFHRKHPDTVLYLHTYDGTRGGNNPVNLREIIDALGIGDAVLLVDQYAYYLGFPDPYMVAAYNAMDVLMNVSMGEGFGIPILEAQACGTPVIVGDWTAMSELCIAGSAVPKEDADPFWTSLAAYQWIPRIDALVEHLETAYQRSATQVDTVRRKARKGTEVYDADYVTRRYWRPVLDRLGERIAAERVQDAPPDGPVALDYALMGAA